MVNVAVLGFGVVGSGVVEVLTDNGQLLEKKCGEKVQVKYILDIRDFPDSPYAGKFVKDFAVIENDPEVQVVVETIGGRKVALDFTERALKAGKSVVTSNKELVAEHGYELFKIAEQTGASYMFEASVGGGIPIIRPLIRCLGGNNIESISGILNGTTNYILTKMLVDGESFEAALAQAQKNGYAEADPTADIEGHDACRKICILSALAFGKQVPPSAIPTKGIKEVTLADMKYTSAAGMNIKLIGRAVKYKGDRACVYVEPHVVGGDNMLSSVNDVFNAVMVTGDAVGDTMFYGRGAGKLPTASAVVGDVIDVVQHLKQPRKIGWEKSEPEFLVDVAGVESRWYVRAKVSQAQLKEAFGQVECIGENEAAGEAAFITAPMTRAMLDKSTEKMEVYSAIRVLD